jgi:hypothetical protein
LQKGPAAQDLWGTVLFDPEQQAPDGVGSYLRAPVGSLPPLPTSRYPDEQDDKETATGKAAGGFSPFESSAAGDTSVGEESGSDDDGTDFDLFGQIRRKYTEEEIKNAIRIRVGFDERPNELGRSQIVIRTNDGKEYIGNDNQFGIKSIGL